MKGVTLPSFSFCVLYSSLFVILFRSVSLSLNFKMCPTDPFWWLYYCKFFYSLPLLLLLVPLYTPFWKIRLPPRSFYRTHTYTYVHVHKNTYKYIHTCVPKYTHFSLYFTQGKVVVICFFFDLKLEAFLDLMVKLSYVPVLSLSSVRLRLKFEE